jgi:hypothetical protein
MKMPLREALEFVRDKLRDQGGVSPVVLADMGKHPNTIVMSLCNMRFEPAARQTGVVAPPLYIDLYVLFYANFLGDHYPEGLDALSSVVRFLQQNPAFSVEALGRVSLEMVNLDLEETRNLTAMLGRVYLPSVLSRVRVTPLPDSD